MESKDKDDVIKRINKYLINREKYEYIRTGIDFFDNFFAGYEDIEKGRGGFLRGKLYSFSGGAGVGKTTFLLFLCKKICDLGNNVLYIDVEDGINDRFLQNVNLEKVTDISKFGEENNRFFIINPSTYGETIDVIRDILKIKKVDFIVIDSIKHLLTDTEVESNSENVEGLMLDKRIEGVFFPILKNIARKNNLVICFIQQVRVKKKGMYFVVDESGGNAFLHSVDCRCLLKQIEEIEVDRINNENIVTKKTIGNIVEIVTKKSRFGMNNITIPILNGRGVSFVFFYFRLLKNSGYIEATKNGIYTFNIGDKIKDYKVKGEENCYKFIKDNFEYIEEFIYSKKLLIIEKSKEDGYEV